jgi:hypothetical protein
MLNPNPSTLIRGLAVLGLVLLVSCESKPSDDGVKITENKALRAGVENPPKAVKSSVRRGYDATGHLRKAENLVHGYEVPVGLKLIRRSERFLVFDSKAGRDALMEFYLGVDRRTGHPFAARSYAITKHRNGFEVRHTDPSLKRLDLPPEYKNTHMFITAGKGRGQQVRLHRLPTHTESVTNRFENDVTSIPAASPVEPPATTKSSPQASKTASKTPPPSALPPPSPTLVRPASSGASVPRAAPHPRQRHPYGTGRTQAMHGRVMDWKMKNPGKKFVD